MITKILKPFTSGRAVYHNKGSCSKLLKYLDHEKKGAGERALYFNQSRANVPAEEVAASIDGHAKGVRATAAKFYSLVISPSEAELRHLENGSGPGGSGSERLQHYTRQVMENYAAGFKLPDGKTLKGEELVWFATFHYGRVHKGSDQAVQEGLARPGQRKGGEQTHVHVVVSRLDCNRQYSLSPTSSKETFSVQDWQQQNARDFTRVFSYGKQTYFGKEDQKEQHLRQRVAKVIQARELDPAYLSPDRVVELARERQYNWKFYRNLSVLENALAKGLQPLDPYAMLNQSAGHQKAESSNARTGSEKGKQGLVPLTGRLPDDMQAGKEVRGGAEATAVRSPTPDKVSAEQLRGPDTGSLSRSLSVFSDLMRSIASTATVQGIETSWEAFPQQKKRRGQSRGMEPRI
jgi:hypothetical protein